MSTANESNKRRKYDDDQDSIDVEESSGSDESASEKEDDDDDDGSYYSTTSTTFVAWLEEDKLCVGELHFANTEHIAASTIDDSDDVDTDFDNGKEKEDDNEYFVVCQLKYLPENKRKMPPSIAHLKPPLVYTFKDSFPFRVIKSSSCIVGIPIHGISEEDILCDTEELTSEYGPFLDYSMTDDIRQTLLDQLSSLESSNKSPNWKLLAPTNDQSVIDGVKAWWKAGEQKTGWDLSKISKEDYTTLSTIHEDEEKEKSGNNIYMSLHKDLCAFHPLHITNNLTRDTIEERFEWRTCLCTYFAWAVPNEAALNAITSLNQPILEIGAGTGYWAWLLTQRNVDVAAYDLVDSHAGEKHRFRHGIVQDGGVEQVSSEDHAGRALFLCWPDIVGDEGSTDSDRGSFAVDTLQAYKGDTFIHVGELASSVVRAAKGWGDPFPPGGSSSSAAFQEELHSHFLLEKRVLLPNWPPYNSHLTIWRRKKEDSSSSSS